MTPWGTERKEAKKEHKIELEFKALTGIMPGHLKWKVRLR